MIAHTSDKSNADLFVSIDGNDNDGWKVMLEFKTKRGPVSVIGCATYDSVHHAREHANDLIRVMVDVMDIAPCMRSPQPVAMA